ncbi:MAG: hypothetical protein GF349_04365 [Candidatus Magasanikbacteria bacterium]|nr:hypothetical protein [Candidatus Magasanikbacteria bacterium]
MLESPKNHREITPNFLSKVSELAEQRIRQLLEIAKDLGAEIFSLDRGKQEILDSVREKKPQRHELVVQKLQEEGLGLEDLSKEALLDRMLGIDILFRYEGKNYAVDVTTGKHTVVKNKQKKFQDMEDIYRELGIDHALIIRLKEEVNEEIVLDLFSRLEDMDASQETFSMVMRYPETKLKKRRKRR